MGAREKGCGVCKARKLLCDRARPSCKRCLKAGKTCDGYGLRLSWPRKNDQRRSMVVKADYQLAYDGSLGKAEFVNTSAWDIQLHHALAAGGYGSESIMQRQPRQELFYKLSAPVRWMPHRLKPSENNLIAYFQSIASTSIAMFGANNDPLLGTLLRMALSANTLATAGVMQSILALASLHLNGPRTEAIKYQVTALQLMRRSASNGLGHTEACQHVAAAMLLSQYEHAVSNGTYHVTATYVCNAKELIKVAVNNDLVQRDTDFQVLLGWMHYQYAMGCFTILHWPYHNLPEGFTPPDVCLQATLNQICNAVGVPYPAGPAHEVLHLLLDVLLHVIDPTDPKFCTEEYRAHVQSLERQLRSISFAEPDNESSIVPARESKLAELYQLAALIYLERSTKNTIDPESPTVQDLAERGFELLEEVGTCQWPFLLLMFGCEAHTDARRLQMLRLITNSRGVRSSSNISYAKRMIEFAWAQDDLGTTAVSYVWKMNLIFSTSRAVPLFL